MLLYLAFGKIINIFGQMDELRGLIIVEERAYNSLTSWDQPEYSSTSIGTPPLPPHLSKLMAPGRCIFHLSVSGRSLAGSEARCPYSKNKNKARKRNFVAKIPQNKRGRVHFGHPSISTTTPNNLYDRSDRPGPSTTRPTHRPPGAPPWPPLWAPLGLGLTALSALGPPPGPRFLFFVFCARSQGPATRAIH